MNWWLSISTTGTRRLSLEGSQRVPTCLVNRVQGKLWPALKMVILL
jgi:hypothetical protein